MQKIIPLLFCMGCLGFQHASAQNCAANLGNALLSVSFGAGPNFGQPLAPGSTSLSYTASSCPGNGQYSIVNSIPACLANAWQSVSRDHTGDYNGYFLLTNGALPPSDLYVQTISGFCQGTTYQFAAWLLNMADASAGIGQPNVRFSIENTDGTVLQSFTTGGIPPATPVQWSQYAFYFTIPAGVTSIVLRISNITAGGIGNGLALDDISFRPAGPPVALQASAFPGNAGIVCTGSTVTFSSSVSNCYPFTAYQWQTSPDNGITWTDIAGANGSVYTTSFGTSGTYLYRLKVASAGNIAANFCSVFSNPITVVAQDGPTTALNISPSVNPVCAGSPVTFTADATNGGSFPFFVWEVNGKTVSIGSSSFTTASLADGDIVTCIMTSSVPCAHPGTLMSNAVTMSVTPSPVPSVSIDPLALTGCSGKRADFTATPVNGGPHPAYQWQVNGVDVGSNSNTFNSSALVDGDVITCLLTSDAVCANPVTATSNAVMALIFPFAIPAVSISASPQSICAGAPLTYTATPVNGGSAPTYQWQVNGVDASGATGDTYTVSGLTSRDLVTCMMTSNAVCASPPTVPSNIVAITVRAATPPSVTISSPAGPVCAGAPVTFSAAAVNGGTAPQYQWQVNGVNTASGSSTYTTSQLADSDRISCTLTSNSLCASPPTASSNTVVLAVRPVATASVTISPSANPVCSGRPVNFKAAAINGGASPQYHWQVNGVNTDGAGPSYTSSQLADGDVISCLMTSDAACVSPATTASNPVKLSVIPSPLPAIQITASADTICSGIPVQFTATAVNGGAAPAYQWQVNGNNTGDGEAQYTSGALADGDGIRCLLSSSATCAWPATVASNTVAMKVYALPDIPPGQVLYLYPGQATPLDPVITGSIDTVVWTPSTGLSDSTVRNPIADLNQAILYRIYVHSPGGCTDTGSVKVILVPRPTVPNAFTPNGDGNNDIFYVLGGTAATVVRELAVFNRWGEEVFHVHDVMPGDRRFGWDGKYRGSPAPAGTYVYVVVLEAPDGMRQQLKGTVLLIR